MNFATVVGDLMAQKEVEANLHYLNETLEQRVSHRTAALVATNYKLVRDMKERERADRRSQDLQLEFFHAARLSIAGQMVGALTHELNQPLTAAVNFINAARSGLAEGNPDEVGMVDNDMEDAVEQILRAGFIIRRFREFIHRGETGKQSESVRSMVQEAAALALAGSDALGVEIDYCFDPNISNVVVDRIQIQQVLVNLISNALEAMKNSTGRRIKIATALTSMDTVEISVVDHGNGIPDELRDRIFEPFFSTKDHGIGLGLSICNSIVESHGGRIQCEPNSDGGMIFRFTVPATPKDDLR